MAIVRPSAAVGVWYTSRINALVDAMHRSAVALVLADRAPEAITALEGKWARALDSLSGPIARGFANRLASHYTVATGMAVDSMVPTIRESASFIRALGQQYFKKVAGCVFRSSQVNGRVEELVEALDRAHQTTKALAVLVTQAQNTRGLGQAPNVSEPSPEPVVPAPPPQAVFDRSLDGLYKAKVVMDASMGHQQPSEDHAEANRASDIARKASRLAWGTQGAPAHTRAAFLHDMASEAHRRAMTTGPECAAKGHEAYIEAHRVAAAAHNLAKGDL